MNCLPNRTVEYVFGHAFRRFNTSKVPNLPSSPLMALTRLRVTAFYTPYNYKTSSLHPRDLQHPSQTYLSYDFQICIWIGYY